jgi:hypothetical protein
MRARPYDRAEEEKAVEPIICETCGTPIAGTKRRRYCSDLCRVRAFRLREGKKRMNAAKPRAVTRPPRQEAGEPTRLTGASLAHLREVREAVMRGRRYTLDAANIIREAREERANR